MIEKNSNTTITVIDPAPKTLLNIQEAPLSSLVEMLDSVGGDLDVLTANFDGNRDLAIFHIEKRLLEYQDSSLKERWDKSIELFHLTRMRMLQNKTVKDLDELDTSDERKARVILARAKLVLGDLLAASTFVAKQKAVIRTERSSRLDQIKDELDEISEEV